MVVQERRNKYEAIVVYVVQSLLVVAIVSVVGVGINSRINTAAIDTINVRVDSHQAAMESFQKALNEFGKSLQETALINATQTQQLVFINEALRECKSELRNRGK